MDFQKSMYFDDCYEKSIQFEDEVLRARTFNNENLSQAKKPAGHPKDLNDLENIE